MHFIHDLTRSGKWILITMAAVFGMHYGGIIEGNFFPVLGENVIHVSTDDDNDGWAEISGIFIKYRDCRYHSTEWYWKGEQVTSRIMIRLSTMKTVGKGQIKYGNMSINMPYDQVEDHSFALVYHQCRPFRNIPYTGKYKWLDDFIWDLRQFSPWKTQTKFYP